MDIDVSLDLDKLRLDQPPKLGSCRVCLNPMAGLVESLGCVVYCWDYWFDHPTF